MCAVWVVFGVIASWALVVSVAWLAIALDAPDDEPDEVDEWGKPTWLNGKEK